MVELTLPNGRIREIVRSDVTELAKISNSPDIIQYYFLDQFGESLEKYWEEVSIEQNEERELGDSFVRPSYMLAIETDKKITGVIGLDVGAYRYSPVRHVFEIHYFVGHDYRNQKIAKTSLNTLIPFCFEKLKAGAIWGRSLPENKPSISLLDKLGFNRQFERVSERGKSKGKLVVGRGLDIKDFNPSLLAKEIEY